MKSKFATLKQSCNAKRTFIPEKTKNSNSLKPKSKSVKQQTRSTPSEIDKPLRIISAIKQDQPKRNIFNS